MGPIELAERLGRWSSGRGPLYLLLAARLRRLIDDADLAQGLRLPPDRALAASLAVGRTTVVAAYDLLRAEGRITRRQGSGTRVAGAPSTAAEELVRTTGDPIFLHTLEPQHEEPLQFVCAAPSEPPPELADAYARALPALARATGDIGYYPFGHPALRQAIAARYASRGVRTEPDQILVTNGGQHALSLVAHAFLRPGDRVLVEAPTYPGALEAFREEAAVLRGLPVGLAGFEAGVREHRPALAYVIPTFHNPTGAVLPTLARQRLVAAAAAAGVPLIEDEVLAELGFPGSRRPPPLAAFGDSVVSIGSLSKCIWGGLRIGWVRAPAAVMGRLARLRAVHDLGGPVVSQLVAADLLSRLDSLLQGAELESRHHHLRSLLAATLPEWEVPVVGGGQTLWVRLPRGDGVSFAQAAMRQGIAVLPGASLDVTGGGDAFLRLHFQAGRDELTEAVRRLTAAWRAYRPHLPRRSAPPSIAI